MSGHWRAELEASLERGNWPIARFVARRAIEARPELVFEDLGFAAALTRHGRPFAGYRERVQAAFARRWGLGRAPRRHDHQCAAIVAADAPNEAWMCCDRWTRKFNRKPNMRAFAERNGVAVPRLYHMGSDVGSIPFRSLPRSAVFKVDPGYDARHLMVVRDGVNTVTGHPVGSAEIASFLRATLAQVRARDPVILVEEFVQDDSPERGRPVNYKLYTMDGRAVILRGSRLAGPGPGPRFEGCFVSPNGVAPPQEMTMVAARPLAYDPPACIDGMIAAAERLGSLIGEPSRIDFYATPAGPVLGEITVNPGFGTGFTPYGDLVLGQAWEIFAGADIPRPPVFPDEVPATELMREIVRRTRRRMRRAADKRDGGRGLTPGPPPSGRKGA